MSETPPPPTIPRALELTAARTPEREALVAGETRLTWAELRDEVHTAVRALLALGTRPGDRVAVWAPNGHRWVVAALAAVSAGAVLVPVNTRYKGDEARGLLARGGAHLLFVEDGFLGNDYLAMLGADEGRPLSGLPALTHLVTLGDAGHPAALTWEDFLAGATGVPAADAAARVANVRPDDPSDLLFTSGTTGEPKGALTSHRQNLATYQAWSARTGVTEEDRYLIINPLFHCFGWKAGVLACLLRGATMVLHPVFGVEATLRAVETERITVLPGPPTLYTSLLEAPDLDRYDLSSLRLAVTGSAVVPVALVERLRAELFPEVLTAYGLTEACGTVTVCALGDDARTVARTAGRPIDGVEVTVVGPDRRPLPPGTDGEILVSGHNVMLGYLADPAASAAAVDAEGRLATGDIGHLDARGYLMLTGRSKEMLVVGGFNVYPAEVEQVLAQHPAVAEAAVLGVPEARLGEVAHAYVTPRAGTRPTPAELIGFCRVRLANFKVPREATVVDALPRNASGKIDKAALRAR